MPTSSWRRDYMANCEGCGLRYDRTGLSDVERDGVRCLLCPKCIEEAKPPSKCPSCGQPYHRVIHCPDCKMPLPLDISVLPGHGVNGDVEIWYGLTGVLKTNNKSNPNGAIDEVR